MVARRPPHVPHRRSRQGGSVFPEILLSCRVGKVLAGTSRREAMTKQEVWLRGRGDQHWRQAAAPAWALLAA
eukprot:11193912-Lingulodinium_polyedra.AAC.1